jgi:hypothetical protein
LTALKSGETNCQKLEQEKHPNFQDCCPNHMDSSAINMLENKNKVDIAIKNESLKCIDNNSHFQFDPRWNAVALEKYQHGDDSGFIKSGENSKKSCKKNEHFPNDFKNYVMQVLKSWQDHYNWGDNYNVVSSILDHVRFCCAYYNELTSEKEMTEKLPAVEKHVDSYFYRDSGGRQWTIKELVKDVLNHHQVDPLALENTLKHEMEAKFFKTEGELFEKDPKKTPLDLKSKPTAYSVGYSLAEVLQIVDPAFNNKFLQKGITVICNTDGDIVSVAFSGNNPKYSDSLYLYNLASVPEKWKLSENTKKGSGTGGGRSALKELVLKSILEGKNGKISLLSYNGKSTSFYKHMKMTCDRGGFKGSARCHYDSVEKILEAFPELGAQISN